MCDTIVLNLPLYHDDVYRFHGKTSHSKGRRVVYDHLGDPIVAFYGTEEQSLKRVNWFLRKMNS